MRTSCPICWARRAGFFPYTRILGQGLYWYVIGYAAESAPDGPLEYVSINAKEHLADLGDMPEAAGAELLRLYPLARQALGIGPDDPSNISVNLGAEASGATIPDHLHIIIVRAAEDQPHSGMGLMLLRQMYDGLDALMSDMLADLAAGAEVWTAERYAERVAYWELKRILFVSTKEQADAIRRP